VEILARWFDTDSWVRNYFPINIEFNRKASILHLQAHLLLGCLLLLLVYMPGHPHLHILSISRYHIIMATKEGR